jgi:hypothetical protein
MKRYTPAFPGRCNGVAHCEQPPVARVVTQSQSAEFQDDVCATHLFGFLTGLIDPDGHVTAIKKLPKETA